MTEKRKAKFGLIYKAEKNFSQSEISSHVPAETFSVYGVNVMIYKRELYAFVRLYFCNPTFFDSILNPEYVLLYSENFLLFIHEPYIRIEQGRI